MRVGLSGQRTKALYVRLASNCSIARAQALKVRGALSLRPEWTSSAFGLVFIHVDSLKCVRVNGRRRRLVRNI